MTISWKGFPQRTWKEHLAQIKRDEEAYANSPEWLARKEELKQQQLAREEAKRKALYRLSTLPQELIDELRPILTTTGRF